MTDWCEGCITYLKLTCSSQNKEGACPCTECVVKVMCDTNCEIWTEWTSFGVSREIFEIDI